MKLAFLKPDLRRLIVVIMIFTFTYYGDMSNLYTYHIIPETISSYLLGLIKSGTYIPETSIAFLGRVVIYGLFWYFVASLFFWFYDTKIKIKISTRIRRAIIFLSFFYLSYFVGVFLHEWGHAIFDLAHGCPFGIFLNPIPLGFSEVQGGCGPNVYGFPINLLQQSMGMIIQFIIGSAAFYFLLFNKSIRKNFTKYSFSYMFSLSNLGAPTIYLLFGSIFREGDVGEILKLTNLNFLILFIPAVVIFSVLTLIFRSRLSILLRLIDPKISEEKIERWKKVFLIIVFIVLLIAEYRYYTSPYKF